MCAEKIFSNDRHRMATNPMMEERGSTEKIGGMSCPDPMDRIKKTTSTAFMPDGFSWPATEEIYEAKRPGWLPFLSIVTALRSAGHLENVQPGTAADRSYKS
jgi:hypothetical protein